MACVNIHDGMTSLYWWNDAVQEDTEASIIAKTDDSRVERVVDRVKELHSYDCPCVVSLPITAGNPDYLQWIADNTSDCGATGRPL